MDSPVDTGAAAALELVPAAAAEVAAGAAGLPPGWAGTVVLVVVLVLRTAAAYWQAQHRAAILPAQASRMELNQAGTEVVRPVVAQPVARPVHPVPVEPVAPAVLVPLPRLMG